MRSGALQRVLKIISHTAAVWSTRYTATRRGVMERENKTEKESRERQRETNCITFSRSLPAFNWCSHSLSQLGGLYKDKDVLYFERLLPENKRIFYSKCTYTHRTLHAPTHTSTCIDCNAFVQLLMPCSSLSKLNLIKWNVVRVLGRKSSSDGDRLL